MHAILIHGMGRTPLAMSILAARLRAHGIRPHLFGYMVTFERWEACLARLERFILQHTRGHDYIIIGHSLGSVLTRAVLPGLTHQPRACFFVAPPAQVCKVARKFAHRRLPKLFMGDMGKGLAWRTDGP
jgi:alpha-beta hydrolase superfamily lysophospholipase